MKKTLRKIASMMLAAVMVLALPAIAFAEDEIPEVDTNGVYHARLGIQAQAAKDETGNQTWMQRIGYYHEPDGDVVCTGTEGEEGYTAYDSTFTDAEIKGNGTYTVTLESKDGLGGAVDISQLQVATDIPKYEDSPISFSNLKVSINNKQVYSYSDVYVDEDDYAGDYVALIAFNNWRSDLKNSGCMDNEGVLPGSGDVSISLTFTVIGFDYDNPDTAETEPATVAPAANNNASSNATTAAADSADSSFPVWVIVVIVAVVVVIVVIAVIASKKKKNN